MIFSGCADDQVDKSSTGISHDTGTDLSTDNDLGNDVQSDQSLCNVDPNRSIDNGTVLSDYPSDFFVTYRHAWQGSEPIDAPFVKVGIVELEGLSDIELYRINFMDDSSLTIGRGLNIDNQFIPESGESLEVSFTCAARSRCTGRESYAQIKKMDGTIIWEGGELLGVDGFNIKLGEIQDSVFCDSINMIDEDGCDLKAWKMDIEFNLFNESLVFNGPNLEYGFTYMDSSYKLVVLNAYTIETECVTADLNLIWGKAYFVLLN